MVSLRVLVVLVVVAVGLALPQNTRHGLGGFIAVGIGGGGGGSGCGGRYGCGGSGGGNFITGGGGGCSGGFGCGGGGGGGCSGHGCGGGGGGGGCRYWCRTPHNQYYCCEQGQQTSHRPIVKPGRCPPVRPQCPPVRSHGGRPNQCSSDSSCNGSQKCCYDSCLRHHTCKPPGGYW